MAKKRKPFLTKSDIEKCIEHIESMVGGDFGFDMECLLIPEDRGLSRIKNMKREDMEKMLIESAKVISKIYQISHSMNTKNSCFFVHEDWRNLLFNPSPHDQL